MSPIEFVKMDSEVLSLTLDSVNSVLKKSLCNDRFVVKMFVAHPTGDELLSFVGGHFILRVTYILDGKEQETQLFLKTSPKNDSRTRFKVNGLLEREVFIFNEVFSKYKEEEGKEFKMFVYKHSIEKKPKSHMKYCSCTHFKQLPDILGSQHFRDHYSLIVKELLVF